MLPLLSLKRTLLRLSTLSFSLSYLYSLIYTTLTLAQTTVSHLFCEWANIVPVCTMMYIIKTIKVSGSNLSGGTL